MKIDHTIKSQVLKWYGGQWKNIGKAVAYWPQHRTRVIPFFGAGNDEFRAPICAFTNASDTNGDVINFFEVLRSDLMELALSISFTPWHEQEYINCIRLLRSENGSPLERARAFWAICWMSIPGGPNPKEGDFRWMNSHTKRWSAPSQDRPDYASLYAISERIQHIHFLNYDGRKLIEEHRTSPESFIWCDPPFLRETRVNKTKRYGDGDLDVQLHYDVANLLYDHPGTSIVNGYQSPLYDDLFESRGWKRIDWDHRTSGKNRTQSIWLSPNTQDALRDEEATKHVAAENQMRLQI